MAYTLMAETSDTFELEEYIHHVEATVDLNDEDSVNESAIALKKLANNKLFIAEHLNRQLLSWKSFQQDNRYTSQTLLLGRGSGFFVRANIWEPPDPMMDLSSQKQLYAYEVPHDHNFSFMTVGYFGSGYETVIYEYEREKTSGRPGDEARLTFLENTSLPQGKIMLYRACKDVHIQKRTSEFSISLNLMIHPPDLHSKDQYFFDAQSDKLGDFVPTPGTGRVMLCRLAKHVGNEASASLLHDVALVHGSRRVRAEAWRSLVALEPAGRESIGREAMLDRDPFVQAVALSILDRKENHK